jgi:hypothetical protein
MTRWTKIEDYTAAELLRTEAEALERYADEVQRRICTYPDCLMQIVDTGCVFGCPFESSKRSEEE